MKVIVLASGSKGNCTYVQTKSHKVLIDIGTSSLQIEKKLREFGIEPQEIDSVFITHAHKDHVAGVNVFYKKYKPEIYLTKNIVSEANLKVEKFNTLTDEIVLDDLKVTVIPTSHDAKDSRGYIMESDNKSMVYMTDTGYIPEKYETKLKNKNIYVFESNHDIEMLMNNEHYPHYLKMRILGDEGHLSNKDSALYLSKYIGKDTKKIFLAHISEHNNTPEIALATLKETLKNKNVVFENISVADQYLTSEEVYV